MKAREKSRMTRSLDLRQNSTLLTANHTLVAAMRSMVVTRSSLLTTMLATKTVSERTNVAHQSRRARMSQRPVTGVLPPPGWSACTPVSVDAEGSPIGVLPILVSCSYLWSIGLRLSRLSCVLLFTGDGSRYVCPRGCWFARQIVIECFFGDSYYYNRSWLSLVDSKEREAEWEETHDGRRIGAVARGICSVSRALCRPVRAQRVARASPQILAGATHRGG